MEPTASSSSSGLSNLWQELSGRRSRPMETGRLLRESRRFVSGAVAAPAAVEEAVVAAAARRPSELVAARPENPAQAIPLSWRSSMSPLASSTPSPSERRASVELVVRVAWRLPADRPEPLERRGRTAPIQPSRRGPRFSRASRGPAAGPEARQELSARAVSLEASAVPARTLNALVRVEAAGHEILPGRRLLSLAARTRHSSSKMPQVHQVRRAARRTPMAAVGEHRSQEFRAMRTPSQERTAARAARLATRVGTLQRRPHRPLRDAAGRAVAAAAVAAQSPSRDPLAGMVPPAAMVRMDD